MFIRRPQLDNLLRRLILGPPKTNPNILTIAGSVRALNIKSAADCSRVDTVTIKGPKGEEITVNDPILVTGKVTGLYDTRLTH